MIRSVAMLTTLLLMLHVIACLQFRIFLWQVLHARCLHNRYGGPERCSIFGYQSLVRMGVQCECRHAVCPAVQSGTLGTQAPPPYLRGGLVVTSFACAVRRHMEGDSTPHADRNAISIVLLGERGDGDVFRLLRFPRSFSHGGCCWPGPDPKGGGERNPSPLYGPQNGCMGQWILWACS